MILRRMILAAVLVLWAAAWVAADEGKWTYNNFPNLDAFRGSTGYRELVRSPHAQS